MMDVKPGISWDEQQMHKTPNAKRSTEPIWIMIPSPSPTHTNTDTNTDARIHSTNERAALILTNSKRGVIECDYCKRDISQVPRIRCADCPQNEQCKYLYDFLYWEG